MARRRIPFGQRHAAQVIVRVREIRGEGNRLFQMLAGERDLPDVEVANRERGMIHVVGRIGPEQ